mmetsp:Transcript_49569/g.131661  ORF Transcript_49569/g.131661 Transcript_49569/m.131661 type:complete len:441 (+) Transcript_49569:94-1416(+)
MVLTFVRMISALALGALVISEASEPCASHSASAAEADVAHACDGQDGDVSAMLQIHGKSPALTKAQMIGFSIYTFPDNTLRHDAAMKALSKVAQYAEELESVGINLSFTAPQGFYAGLADPDRDAALRFELMKDAVETARAKANYDPSPSTLKVFMAPEFFFRGSRGAYDANTLYGCPEATSKSKRTCKATIQILLEKMKGFVSEERWSDWLFVFGTIVAAEPRPGASSTHAAITSESLFYNVAPVFRGGPGGERFVLPKTYISGIDFLNCLRGHDGSPDGCVNNPRQLGDPEYTAIPAVAQSYLSDMGFQTATDNMFTVQGVLFGLEICLDHFQAVLHTNMEKKGLLPGGGVQVHLITSAGMSITYGLTPFGAPEFLQDGGEGARSQIGTGQPLLQPEIPALSKDWPRNFTDIFSLESVKPSLRVFSPVPIPASPRFSP